MTDLPLIPILGPFGGNQLVTALDARHPELGTTIGQYRRHGNLPHSPSLCREVVTELCRAGYETVRFGLDQERESFLFPCNTPTKYKEALYCPRYGRRMKCHTFWSGTLRQCPISAALQLLIICSIELPRKSALRWATRASHKPAKQEGSMPMKVETDSR